MTPNSALQFDWCLGCYVLLSPERFAAGCCYCADCEAKRDG